MSQQSNGLRAFQILRTRNAPRQRGPVTARVACIPYGECNPATKAIANLHNPTMRRGDPIAINQHDRFIR